MLFGWGGFAPSRIYRIWSFEQLYLEVVEIRVESRRDRVIEGSCGFCLFKAAPGPIRPLPMTDSDIVPDFCLFGSFARFSFAAARRAWKACGQSLFAPFLGFAFGARIDHILPTLPLVGGLFVNVRFGFSAVRRAWKAVDNPYSRCIRVSRSGPGLTTLPTLPAVGGRSRFGAFHSATALRGFFINIFFWFGPWKCGQSFPSLSAVPRSGLGLPTFPQPRPASALGPRSVIRFAASRAGVICTRRWRSRRACGRRR